MQATELYPLLCNIFSPRTVSCLADERRLLLSCLLAEARLGLCRMHAEYRARLELADGCLLFSEGLFEEKLGPDFSWGSRSSTMTITNGVLTGSIRERRSFFGSRYELEFSFGPGRLACQQLAQSCGLVFQDRPLALELLINEQGLRPLPPLSGS